MECTNRPSEEFLNSLEAKQKEALDELYRERQFKQRAERLGVCHCCSATLISETTEILDKPKRYLFGLIVIKKINWGYRTICPNNKEHYENKGYYSDDGYY